MDAEWLILYYLYSGSFRTTQESMKNRQNKEVDDLTQKVLLSACGKIEIDPASDKLSVPLWSISECYDNIGEQATIKPPSSQESLDYPNNFCFKLPTTLGTFAVRIKTDSFYDKNKQRPFFIYMDYPMFTRASELYQSSFRKEKKSTVSERVVIRYSVQAYIKETRESKNPYAESSNTDCLANCTMKTISEKCKCLWFYSPKKQESELAYCNYNHSNCGQGVFRHTGILPSACSEQCITAREYATYQWQVTSRFDDEEN